MPQQTLSAVPTPKRVTADERRQQLIETALALFSQNGFSGTTTREIARAAGVNEAIIFRFFPHKDDLYGAILEHKSAEASSDALVEELRAAAAADDDAAVIHRLVRHIVDHHRRDPQFLRLMLHSALEGHSLARQFRARHFEPLRLFLLDYVADRQGAGRFREGDPEVLVRAILAVPVHHGMVETLLAGEHRTIDDVAGLYATIILEGLRRREHL